MPSVAIVGFSNKTYEFCKLSKADEMWTMNHAFLVKDIPRIDALFEIHKPEWFGRKESKKAGEYVEWLKEPHDFPIYMHEEHDDMPSSVRYPLVEIVDKLLPGLVWVDEQGLEIVREKYFTSSFAYMIALAIYEGFDTLEIYGIDMEGDTEYGYQRPCGEFWIGYALGQGIKVILQEPCTLCYAPLYGYDVVPYVDDHRVKEIMELYQKENQEREGKLGDVVKRYNQDPSNGELEEEYQNLSAAFFAYKGAITAASRLLMESDTFISRQFVELKRTNYINAMEYHKGLVNLYNGTYFEKRENGQPFEEEWNKYIEARASMYLNMGAGQLLRKLMDLIDMRPIDLTITMDIREEE